MMLDWASGPQAGAYLVHIAATNGDDVPVGHLDLPPPPREAQAAGEQRDDPETCPWPRRICDVLPLPARHCAERRTGAKNL